MNNPIKREDLESGKYYWWVAKHPRIPGEYIKRCLVMADLLDGSMVIWGVDSDGSLDYPHDLDEITGELYGPVDFPS